MEADQRHATRKNAVLTRRALLMVNPSSRRGAGAIAAIGATLEQAGFLVRLVSPETREDISRLIEHHAEAVDCVVIGGGDGTLNAAAPALLRTGLPLGIIPLGTANDLARTLGLPVILEAAAAIIAAGATRRVDLGLVNGHPFFNVASLGLSVDLAVTLTGGGKRRWGRLSYALAALRVLAKARPFRAMIVAQDKAVGVKTYQIAVGNGRYYGGGLPVRHDACIADGRLDLYSLEFTTAWRLVLSALSFGRGRHCAWKEVRDVSCTRFEVRTRRPQPVNLDGEMLTLTPARFELLPGAIEIYVPVDSADQVRSTLGRVSAR